MRMLVHHTRFNCVLLRVGLAQAYKKEIEVSSWIKILQWQSYR